MHLSPLALDPNHTIPLLTVVPAVSLPAPAIGMPIGASPLFPGTSEP